MFNIDYTDHRILHSSKAPTPFLSLWLETSFWDIFGFRSRGCEVGDLELAVSLDLRWEMATGWWFAWFIITSVIQIQSNNLSNTVPDLNIYANCLFGEFGGISQFWTSPFPSISWIENRPAKAAGARGLQHSSSFSLSPGSPALSWSFDDCDAFVSFVLP